MATVGQKLAAQGLLGDSAPNSIPGVYNFDPPFLAHWRKAKANVRTGTARARLLFAGDSTTRGSHAGTGGTGNENSSNVWAHPARVAALLNTVGLSTSSESIFGASGNTLATMQQADPRLVVGADWVLSNAATVTLGGLFYNAPSNGTTSLAFTPAAAFDTVVVFYAINSGLGTFTVNVDGGSALGAAIATANATPGFGTATRTTTLATHTVNIQRTTGGAVFIAGILTYDSTAQKVDVLNCGWGGSKVADWANAQNPYNARPALATLAPDLTIINLGINDWNAPTAPSSFAADYQTIITSAKTSGDVILCAPAPSDPATRASVATQASYIAQIKQLAVANNCPLVDFTYRFGSYSAANALGEYFDTLHPNVLGQSDMAEPIARMLLTA